MKNQICRGDIVYMNLPQQRGNIQSGFRPCIVVSNNRSNEKSKILNVIPLSAQIKQNPVHVLLSPKDIRGYLEKESDVLTEQIVTRSIEDVISKVGHLSEKSDVMRAIEKSIQFQLGLG